VSQFGLAPVAIWVDPSSAPGSAPMRKTFAAGAATSGTGCPTRVDRKRARIPRSRGNATIQAARRFDEGLSIILIRVLSIIVTTLTP
jgi:hypothetical protein